MAVEVKTLGSWMQTRNVLFENLAMNMSFQGEQDFSDDPASDFMKAQANIDTIMADLQSHSVNGLKLIDEAIKDSDIIEEIAAASAEAKKATDAIKNVIKTVQGLTDVVNKVSGVVSKIAGLPFL